MDKYNKHISASLGVVNVLEGQLELAALEEVKKYDNKFYNFCGNGDIILLFLEI